MDSNINNSSINNDSTQDTLDLSIDTVAFGGSGIGRIDNKVYFVPDAVPGDLVKVKVVEEKKKYCTANIVSFIKKSPLRAPSPCPYSHECGGCQWIEIDYQKQLEWKKNFVVSSLSRIGKVPADSSFPIIGSEDQFFYRNKILVRTRIIKEDGSNKMIVGFFKKGSRDFIQIKNCKIAAPSINLFLEQVSSINFPDSFLDHCFKLEIQELYESYKEGRARVILTIYPPEQEKLDLYREMIPILKTLDIVEDCVLITDTKNRFLLEKDTVAEKEISFFTSSSQFQQVNINLNKKLRKLIYERVPSDSKRVLDVFCGSGNLSLGLNNEYVEGVEINPLAIETANYNVEYNSLKNRVYLAGKSEAHLWKCVKKGEFFDTIIADPPREGMYKEIIPLSLLNASTIIYVSCSPPTLARDIATLYKKGYCIKDILCLDFFPNTFHVETVCVLSKLH